MHYIRQKNAWLLSLILHPFQIISRFDFFGTSNLLCIYINNMYRYIAKWIN